MENICWFNIKYSTPIGFWYNTLRFEFKWTYRVGQPENIQNGIAAV